MKMALSAGMMASGILVSPAALAETLDERINEAVAPFTDALAGAIFTTIPIMGADFPLIVGWLILAGLVFTLYMGFINFRRFGLAVRVVRGDYDEPGSRGEVSHFQALTSALSGTVGLGNIAGVAVAIGIGGPGATFWMICAGFLSMTLKFTECTLAVKYRRIREDGVVSGGPMYYLAEGLKERGWGRLGMVLAPLFAVCCVAGSFGGGNMFQVNQAFQQVQAVTGGNDSFFVGRGWLFGLIMAGLVALVIVGGIKSIGRVTAKLVPFMCGIYMLAGIVVILANLNELPAALWSILAGAFSAEGIEGGMIGVLIQGFRRAAFSNEAGIGSAPIAHAAVKTNDPASEGLVALLEPFIDTVVVCTVTALTIVITNAHTTSGLDGIGMTSAAFATVINWFPVILSFAVVLFAFSTQISWSYYGLKAWTYLLGESRTAELSYKALFCAFTVIGAAMSLGKVVDFSDAAMFAMAIPNIIGLYLLAPVAKREAAAYIHRIESGAIKSYRPAKAV